MDATLFDQLEQTVNTAGPAAAIDKLAEELTARKDYAGLFYALLMKKRYEVGLAPIATGSNQDVTAACTRELIRTLHDELLARLRDEIMRVQNFEATGTTVRELVEGRDWLFADDFYHIDLSHLNSVVQMATQLEKCDELALARDLCQYGMRLSPRFRYQSEPPLD